MFMPILPRPTNPISIKRAFLLAYDDTIRIHGRAAEIRTRTRLGN
jgi:hypothetical protein